MTAARRTIGDSDLSVFPLSLGGNVFGWTADRDTSFAVLDGYTAGGGNFIDTADGYSAWVPGNTGGDSERIIGEWFEARGNRDDIVLATKVSQHPDFRGLAADNIRRAADASLERLRTDHIDLYYAHFDDETVPLEETLAALSGLVDAGKVRYIGISNYTPARIEEWMRITQAEGFHRPVALQPHYNLVERDYREHVPRHRRAREPRRDAVLRAGVRLPDGQVPRRRRRSTAPRAGGAAKYLDDRGRDVLDALDRGGRRARRIRRVGRPRVARRAADGRRADRQRAHAGAAPGPPRIGRTAARRMRTSTPSTTHPEPRRRRPDTGSRPASGGTDAAPR